MPNGTYGGVRGEKFIKNYPLLDCQKRAIEIKKQVDIITIDINIRKKGR